METSEIDELLNIFNVSASGSLTKEEFVFCWTEWIKKVARPSSALVVVDVQNDFISGSLAIINCPAGQNGEDVSTTVKQSHVLYFLNSNFSPIFFSKFIDTCNGKWKTVF